MASADPPPAPRAWAERWLFLKRCHVYLEARSGVRVLLDLKLKREQRRNGVGNSRGPVREERPGVTARIQRRTKMIEQRHGVVLGSGFSSLVLSTIRVRW